MNSEINSGRALAAALLLAVLIACAGTAQAQSIGALNSELAEIAPQVGAAASNQSAAGETITRLDQAEAAFAKLADNPKTDRGELQSAYTRLEEMLNRMYTTYKQKKDDCIAQISNGGQCDYDVPEQLSLQALYPLSWLHFQGAALYSNQPEQAKRLLNQAIDGFTESTLVIVAPELIRENLLGRAYCERELGKYDRSEYDKAIADFKQIMNDGPNTNQYKPSQQGLATTYAAMGKLEEATKFSSGAGGGGGQLMFSLQNLFKAEAATSDANKRAQYHRQAVELIKSKENDQSSWAIAIAAVAQYVHDPVAEFGNSSDPFEKWLLANVLYSKHQGPESAKYYLDAARSGKYPKAYKFAADIYYSQKRFDQVQQLVDELARQPGNPDAQWGSYMKVALPHEEWQQGGMKNAQLEAQWTSAAQDYLKSYPHGQYAYEPRFFLADRLERSKQYLDAAKEYGQVGGNAEYEFNAKFRAARCNYLALVEAGSADNKKAPQVDRDALRNAAISGLEETLRMEPAAERSVPGQRAFMHDTKGEAIYMLAGLLEHQPKVDDARMASLLDGFDHDYPKMSDRFNDVAEWRIKALDNLGRYSEIERSINEITERGKGNFLAADFIKELGIDLWKNSGFKKAKGDAQGALGDARLTAAAYSYFADLVAAGKMQAKNLTGTLSILGKAYIAMGDVDHAEKIFNQVVKADPGSPDANAGLARIAQAKKDYKNAVELWTRVESVAAESDDLWYEAKFNVASIYAAQGNVKGACDKLAVTRSEHPSLGTPEMKAQWDSLQRKICLGK
ncbi:MAG: tetratricopeptide repeat protein [Candidatus Binataceae bacterium]